MKKPAILGIVIGIVLVVTAGAVYLVAGSSEGDDIVWDLTLIGRNNNQVVLSYQDIRDMPSEKARGGFFTTVGVINGPYDIEGVPLRDLCDLVGGITDEDVVSVTATDGYGMVFDYEQLTGDIQTYDLETVHEVPHDQFKILLIYKQDSHILSQADGQPLRLAVVGDAGQLTEGHNWVKWVNTIEVIRLE
jgi:DMSO/TMAO reductase YedYZ molybdopterin-dependent catalytic subunit